MANSDTSNRAHLTILTTLQNVGDRNEAYIASKIMAALHDAKIGFEVIKTPMTPSCATLREHLLQIDVTLSQINPTKQYLIPSSQMDDNPRLRQLLHRKRLWFDFNEQHGGYILNEKQYAKDLSKTTPREPYLSTISTSHQEEKTTKKKRINSSQLLSQT